MTVTTLNPASNADAVKIIGRSAIMSTAHLFVKILRVSSFGEALTKAWADARRKVAVKRESVAMAKELKAESEARAVKGEAAKNAFTGDKSSRSPLNPHWDSMGRLSGKMGGAYTSAIVGR